MEFAKGQDDVEALKDPPVSDGWVGCESRLTSYECYTLFYCSLFFFFFAQSCERREEGKEEQTTKYPAYRDRCCTWARVRISSLISLFICIFCEVKSIKCIYLVVFTCSRWIIKHPNHYTFWTVQCVTCPSAVGEAFVRLNEDLSCCSCCLMTPAVLETSGQSAVQNMGRGGGGAQKTIKTNSKRTIFGIHK